MRRLAPLLLATLLLSSCGLVKLPFKVAGAVVEGTAKTGKKAYDASARALTKTDEEKAAAAREKAREEAAEKAKEKPAEKQAPAEPRADDAAAIDADAYAPLPEIDAPLPDDAPLPYQDQP